MSLIFAHRGASGTHPENTMLSFYEAERVKADGIELDVQLTKDGEVVIIHDETVDRTTDGKGKVKDFTLSEIKKLNAAHQFQKGRLKAEIPTLDSRRAGSRRRSRPWKNLWNGLSKPIWSAISS